MAELFSERCLTDICPTARRLGEATCSALVIAGARRCPGMATTPKGKICSLPGEIAEVIASDYPGVPPSMILDGARGVAAGTLLLADLPPPSSDPGANICQWGGIIQELDAAMYPGEQQE